MTDKELINKYKRLILKMAKAINAENAEELVATGIEKLIALRPSYNKDKSKFWTYARYRVFCAMRDDYKSRLSWFGRRTTYMQMLYIEDIKGKEVELLVDEDIEDILIRRERSLIIKRLRKKLPPRFNNIIKLIYWNGMTITEAAKILKISGGRCSQLHKQALKELKKLLEKEDGKRT